MIFDENKQMIETTGSWVENGGVLTLLSGPIHSWTFQSSVLLLL